MPAKKTARADANEFLKRITSLKLNLFKSCDILKGFLDDRIIHSSAKGQGDKISQLILPARRKILSFS
jgi:hypothetical protein